MTFPPARIDHLIQQIESGQAPTREDLQRLATLQALDMAKLGHDFVLAMHGMEQDQARKLLADAARV